LETPPSPLAPVSLSARFANVPAFLGLNRGGLEAALKQPVNDDNFAIIERLAHWAAAVRMWSQAPWLGIGVGNYAVSYPAIIQQDIHLLRWQEPLGHAHNIYLNILAESGLVGLASYLIFWIVLVTWLWTTQWRIPIERQSAWEISWSRALVIGVIGVIVHLSVHNLVDNLFVQGNYLVIGFWIAILNTQGENSCSLPK
jgi:putative inorganic carbon (HCO3(-)) transporter